MAEKNNTFKIVVLVILIIAAAAGGFIGYRYMHKKNASGEADNVLATLKQVIPMLGKETDVSMGDGRDPLPIFEVNGIDIVGKYFHKAIDALASQFSPSLLWWKTCLLQKVRPQARRKSEGMHIVELACRML